MEVAKLGSIDNYVNLSVQKIEQRMYKNSGGRKLKNSEDKNKKYLN